MLLVPFIAKLLICHIMHPFFENFSHEADIGIRGVGHSPQEAFAMAAMALTQTITKISNIHLAQTIELSCTAPELELLFYEWINQLIYEMDTRRMVFGEFQVKITDHKLQAILKGEPIDPKRHDLAVDPKGATFTELKVTEHHHIWTAQCVVDV